MASKYDVCDSRINSLSRPSLVDRTNGVMTWKTIMSFVYSFYQNQCNQFDPNMSTPKSQRFRRRWLSQWTWETTLVFFSTQVTIYLSLQINNTNCLPLSLIKELPRTINPNFTGKRDFFCLNYTMKWWCFTSFIISKIYHQFHIQIDRQNDKSWIWWHWTSSHRSLKCISTKPRIDMIDR